MKGNVDCHIPNNKYREGYDTVFGKQESVCAGCGKKIEKGSLCLDCEKKIMREGPCWEM